MMGENTPRSPAEDYEDQPPEGADIRLQDSGPQPAVVRRRSPPSHRAPAGKNQSGNRQQRPFVLPDEKLSKLAGEGARVRGAALQRKELMIYLAPFYEDEQQGNDAKRVLGNLARNGRELVAPLHEYRHSMLYFLNRVLCGYNYLKKDPNKKRYVLNPTTMHVVATVGLWERMLRQALDQDPSLLMPLAEAMQVPEDSSDDDS